MMLKELKLYLFTTYHPTVYFVLFEQQLYHHNAQTEEEPYASPRKMSLAPISMHAGTGKNGDLTQPFKTSHCQMIHTHCQQCPNLEMCKVTTAVGEQTTQENHLASFTGLQRGKRRPATNCLRTRECFRYFPVYLPVYLNFFFIIYCLFFM